MSLALVSGKNAAMLKYFKPRIAVVGRVDEWLDHTHFASYTIPWWQSYLTSGILYKRDKRFFIHVELNEASKNILDTSHNLSEG